jgi:hypothetical protein
MVRRLSPHEVHRRQRTQSGILSPENVAVIKWRQAQGESDRALAEEWNMSLWSIRAIRRGDTWNWVEARAPAEVLEAQPLSEAQLAEIAEGKARLARFMQDQLARALASPEQLARAASLGARVGGEASPLDRLLGEANSLLDAENELDKLKEVKP